VSSSHPSANARTDGVSGVLREELIELALLKWRPVQCQAIFAACASATTAALPTAFFLSGGFARPSPTAFSTAFSVRPFFTAFLTAFSTFFAAFCFALSVAIFPHGSVYFRRWAVFFTVFFAAFLTVFFAAFFAGAFFGGAFFVALVAVDFFPDVLVADFLAALAGAFFAAFFAGAFWATCFAGALGVGAFFKTSVTVVTAVPTAVFAAPATSSAMAIP
jgi:hypothetical protein